MTIGEDAWGKAVTSIRSAGRVALTCHIGPDGDALGSMLALAHILRLGGKETVASWGEPFSIPGQYEFLPVAELASPPSGYPAAPDLMITFDAGSLDRLGSLEPNARAARELIVVDHHASNEHFGTINLIDPLAAASAVIVFELARRLGEPLDEVSATCLYTGLVTDTGSFKYRNTTPEVHGIAAELLRHGVRHDEIARIVFDTHPVAYLKLAAAALERTELIADAGVVWTWVTQKDLEEHGLGLDHTEALIDVVRTAQEADVACVLKEQPDGNYKVSMRSKGASDVGAVATSFGGGGHALAAGFTTADGDPRAAVAQIVVRLAATAPLA